MTLCQKLRQKRENKSQEITERVKQTLEREVLSDEYVLVYTERVICSPSDSIKREDLSSLALREALIVYDYLAKEELQIYARIQKNKEAENFLEIFAKW